MIDLDKDYGDRKLPEGGQWKACQGSRLQYDATDGWSVVATYVETAIDDDKQVMPRRHFLLWRSEVSQLGLLQAEFSKKQTEIWKLERETKELRGSVLDHREVIDSLKAELAALKQPVTDPMVPAPEESIVF